MPAIPVAAGYETGVRALERGNAKKALRVLEPLAERGDVEAQLAVGEIYRYGSGVAVDPERAVAWFRRAAEQGNADGEYALGAYLAGGYLPSVDRRAAVPWLRKAAEQAHAQARRDLGDAYRDGELVERDYHEAVRWYRACADQDRADCQCRIGTMYAEGHGVEQDDETALAWFRRSAEGGDPDGMYHLARLFLNGRGVEQNPRVALALLRKAAAGDHDDAQLELARLYLDGKHVPRDPVRAITFAAPFARNRREARELIDDTIDTLDETQLRDAAAEANSALNEGRFRSAALLAELLAHRGVRAAQFLLGFLCTKGWGTTKDPARAYQWLLLGEEHDPEAAKLFRRRVSAELSREEVATLHARAARWEPERWDTSDMPERPSSVDREDVTQPRSVGPKQAPEYPEAARRSKSEARVVLEGIITSDGTVSDIVVLSSGKPGLGFEDAAVDAVSRWTYEPATRDGVPIDVWFTVQVDFEWQGGR